MESAITLMQAAFSLLLFLDVQGGSIPEEFRLQALEVVNRAVAVAEDRLASAEVTREQSTRPSLRNNDRDMTEEKEEEVAATSQARIKITSPFKEQGLGREFKAIDPESGITRWDEASDLSNILVLGIEVFGPNGKRDRSTNVHVAATDEEQSRDMNGKTNYQYLFKTPGEHTLTFEVHGVTESITVKAE